MKYLLVTCIIVFSIIINKINGIRTNSNLFSVYQLVIIKIKEER